MSKEKVKKSMTMRERSALDLLLKRRLHKHSLAELSHLNEGSLKADHSAGDQTQEMTQCLPSLSVDKLKTDARKILNVLLQEKTVDIQNVLATDRTDVNKQNSDAVNLVDLTRLKESSAIGEPSQTNIDQRTTQVVKKPARNILTHRYSQALLFK